MDLLRFFAERDNIFLLLLLLVAAAIILGIVFDGLVGIAKAFRKRSIVVSCDCHSTLQMVGDREGNTAEVNTDPEVVDVNKKV